MGFELAAAYVTISADTSKSDAGIARVESDLKTLPASRTIGLKADTSGFDAGMARARRELAAVGGGGYELAGQGYGLAPPAPGVRPSALPSALPLDNRGFATQLAKARADLASLPKSKTVRITADTGMLSAAVTRAKGLLASVDLKSVAAGAAGGLGIGAGIQALQGAFSGVGAAVKGAGDLAESTSKVDVVYGSAAAKVHAFAEEMKGAFGTSRQEILDSASGFGLLAKAAGQSQEKAAGFSIELAKLADDAASFYNVPLGEALTTIKSALVGESEPIRRFGVLLNEDAVKAEALRLGLSKTGKEITESGKVMARYSLIQKGMSDVQGDHLRTADSFNNQWKEFTGRVYDLGVTLGGVAVPALNLFLRGINPVARAIGAVADVLSKTIGLFGDFFGRAAQAAGFSKAIQGAAAPPGTPGEADATPGGDKAGVAKGLEAAGETLRKEKESDAQKRLVDRVRAEQEAAGKVADNARVDAAVYKQQWIDAEAKIVEARLNRKQQFFLASDDEVAYAKVRNAELARVFAARNFESARLTAKDVGGVKAPSTEPQRNFIEAFKSVAKEKIGIALAIKQQGIPGAIGAGANLLGAMGEAGRLQREREQERRENYQTEFLGGREMSQRIQSAALGADKKKEEKQIAENTRQAVVEAKNTVSALLSLARELGRGGGRAGAAYQ